MVIHETLQSFFGGSPKQDRRNFYRYSLKEEGNNYTVCQSEEAEGSILHISYNEDHEFRLVWSKDGNPIMTIQPIGVRSVIPVQDDEEESLEFILDRMPSRMIKVQLKPFFAVEMGIHWEVCDDCD
ncbi:DUF3979 family protein [Microbacteriaceae bacterium 4G12]